MQTTAPTAETAPTPEKLIDNSIPSLVTEVPSIEVPTRFENLLDEPTIIFKSASGSENRVSSKVIKRLREKQNEMDRARELLRNRLSSTTTAVPTTTQSPFITVKDTRPKRPKPFSKLIEGQSKKNIRFPATPSTTIATLIQASTTVPLSSTLSVRDKMVAARNRLRIMMGHRPIGMTTTQRPKPTTPTPSSPTTMEKKRLKIIEKLEVKKQEEEEKLEEFINSTPDPLEANVDDIEDPSVISVTAKSTIGDVGLDVEDVNPLVLISPTFAPDSPHLANLRVTPEPFTTTPVNQDTTLRLSDDVLDDVPTRMQDTLMRLMKKTGLKKDPFAKLVTTAVTLIDTDEEFNDFTPPTPRQDPLLTKNLRPDAEEAFEGLETPRPHQDNLLGQLRGNDDGVFDGLSTPSPRQNYLLKQLKANQDGVYEGLSTPSSRQNYLLKQLKANQDGVFEGLSTPSSRQNYLLKQLKANDDGIVSGLTTPNARQNYLLRQLQSGHNENLQLELPNRKQNPLLRQLKKAQNQKIIGLQGPSTKQDPLLKSLREPLFRGEEGFNPDGLNLPNKRQNPLLRILRFDRRERILSKGLTPPRYKQNPLFRQLVAAPQRYSNDFLQLPPRQQNKLLAILKRHGGDNFNAGALLTVPRFKEETDYETEDNDDVAENFDDDDDEDDEYAENDYEEFGDDDYEDEEVISTDPPRLRLTTTSRPRTVVSKLRPIMPKSKFEIFQTRTPVEEVTFRRVNEPLTADDKKEGIVSIDCVHVWDYYIDFYSKGKFMSRFLMLNNKKFKMVLFKILFLWCYLRTFYTISSNF